MELSHSVFMFAAQNIKCIWTYTCNLKHNFFFFLLFTRYLALHILVNGTVNCQIMKMTSNFFDASHLQSCDWWHDLPWAETFKRFLGIPPACPQDQQLLVSVLKLLRLYLNTCWRSERGVNSYYSFDSINSEQRTCCFSKQEFICWQHQIHNIGS